METRIVNVDTRSAAVAPPDPLHDPEQRACPRCNSHELFPLDKAREEFNTCYMCRECRHVFSPAA